MPGYNYVFQRVLIRQAAANSAAPHDVPAQIAWLTALQTAQFASAKNGESTLQASTMNGKSIQLTIPSGMTKTDVMTTIEMAIECLEAGLPGPVNIAYGRSYK